MEDLSGSMAGETVDFEQLATEALKPTLTDEIFVKYAGLFVEICARWIISESDFERKIAAFGKILPFAPHLAEHVERFLSRLWNSPIIGSQNSREFEAELGAIEESKLCIVLLGTFRLLSFDCRTFAKYVRPLSLERLFNHTSRIVRLLAIRTFCLYVHAADYATQDMLKRYVGEGQCNGEWEGQRIIDYRFLSLWEEKRWKNLQSELDHYQMEATEYITQHKHHQLSPYTVNVSGILLPRLNGMSVQEKPSELISTATTESNLHKIARGIIGSRPLLLTGLPGSGKTLLVRHLAWQMNKLDSMVTLHLNEQSDAKMLIGMYATGAKPGTFSWRPGVLTTAVKEGRWIFVEDLDRAPNEAISTLLPLIERGELLIPNRGETVRAARGFRIIATMRSTLNTAGQQIVPRQNMIGHRFWNAITVTMPELEEFERIISVKYPSLYEHVPRIAGVYERLLKLYSDAKFSSENGTSLRALTPRDLLKWCDRIAALLIHHSSFSPAQNDDIFMEAFDCFAGNLRSEYARAKVMAYVAEELHIDPQRRDHLLTSREVKLEIPSKSKSSGVIQIGRARLSRHKGPMRAAFGRPFSTNGYTLRLIEKVAVAVDRQEPLLLVGETGTGKTTCIQYLAEQLGRKLVAFNLSQQSESGDLLGGYKPVNVRSLVIPLKDEFDEIFDATFSRKKNPPFIEKLGKRVAKGDWRAVCKLWRWAVEEVNKARRALESQASSPDPDGGQPKKKRKTDSLPANFPKARWEKFASDLHDLEAQLANGSEAFAFSFMEGNIVKAVRNGDWVLLDEINLASSDTLEALADLLSGGADGTPSILLTETGNIERVVAHPNFRVFAAMNPATDVGKKDLPPGIRSRFTELYVESPDGDKKSLQSIVLQYLGGETNSPDIFEAARNVTDLYLDIQERARSNMLVDGADQKAHFSLRTLTRTLSFAREMAPLCSLRRALYEGFHMSFLTFLGKASEDIVAPLIVKSLFPKTSIMKAELGKSLQQPGDGRSYVRQGHYWLRQGQYTTEEQPHYIITPFVKRNMNNLIRAASTRRYPVLIQGPTSSGKTSMIEYLAKRSGNKFVRINNHEHTDLQEYLGSYISSTDGKLIFQEGILVKALREGHWIVLDELNLAPTDVLEALNRLLDDNRELLIPETQEVVRPHEDFMLFATQNPAGLYGGRKVLSRAFRNRFLELHFDDIPVEELTEILHRRTMIPETWCKRIVNVYRELSTLRQENRLFEQKSFATLRDLFRWAQRKADTIHDLANNGYMLLAERVRKEDERVAVKNIIESVMSAKGPKVRIDEEQLYSESTSTEMKTYNDKTSGSGDVVWTRAMRRLFVLVAHAIRNNEPVLLVGDTGCGKTTVCQMLANVFEKQLHIVNAHQNTETGDLIGAQRPIRNRTAIEEQLHRQLLSALRCLASDTNLGEMTLVQLLELYDKLEQATRDIIPASYHEEIKLNRVKVAALFEWADGSIVHAMKSGQFFLLDEISLADDSVLERLNSVLEPSRTLLLAEKGPIDSMVTADEGFQFLATMNPGGDYGKKELSPALRNRFTEIWVPALSDVEDILEIVRSKLKPSMSQYAGCIVSFAQWFNDKFNTSVASSISIRDTLAWIAFVNGTPNEDPIFRIVHGAAMVFIDTLGANPAGLLTISTTTIDEERQACLHRLSKLLGHDVTPMYFDAVNIKSTDQALQLGSFEMPKLPGATADSAFSFEAPTTRSNAMRVVRALQLSKPILLEGNPGVGKTTLVSALAKAIGKPLTRLNLSEQTDLMDLFGSDVPVEGGQAGTFAWRDAPFLKAMKRGDWVLLDEMNLASQSVLEGLNAVLDHRGEVYISELDQTFLKHPEFRVFAAQNPHHQGGGRKGLPASFVNRFTVVYADVFRPYDLSMICAKIFPGLDETEVKKLITFVSELDQEVVQSRTFGALGGPWEFNLRDILRLLQLLAAEHFPGSAPDFIDAMFVQRFRSETDRNRLLALFEKVYGPHEPRLSLYHNMSPASFQVGLGMLSRNTITTRAEPVLPPQVSQLRALEAITISARQCWPVILVGPSGCGKTSLLNQLASFRGADLVTFSMNTDIDAMDLVGGYEQVDPSRERHRFLQKVERYVREEILSSKALSAQSLRLLQHLERGPTTSLERLLPVLQSLSTIDETALPLTAELQSILHTPQQIDGARFQWVDGILVRALEQGKWLVLDNANLCSSAVLDRLNSLLEPDGYLSINEHSTADGTSKIVRPHSNFRIFMTMDPRFGELSRAMRNRAVEICLLSNEANNEFESKNALPAYSSESAMYRFRQFLGQQFSSKDTIDPKFENLSFADNDMLASFATQVSIGLMAQEQLNDDNESLSGPSLFEELQLIGSGSNTRHVVSKIGKLTDFFISTNNSQALCKQPTGTLFEDSRLLTFHPLVNELYSRMRSDSSWRTSLYEAMMNLYNMQQAINMLPTVRQERRPEKKKLPSFLQSYWQALGRCIEATGNSSDQGEIDSNHLEPLQDLFWVFYTSATSHTFDRATFRTHLNMLHAALKVISTDFKTELTATLSRGMLEFGSVTQPTSGFGMERIWSHFKPDTPKSQKHLFAILYLESLADRFDAAMWKSSLNIDGMVQLRERFSNSLTLVRKQNVGSAELIKALEIAVCELEQNSNEDDNATAPYFEDVFEGLCQLLDVAHHVHPSEQTYHFSTPQDVILTRAKASILARRPTKMDLFESAHLPSHFFASLYRYLGLEKQSASPMALQKRVHSVLLSKIYTADEVQLSQLYRFEAELQVLAQQLSLDSNRITSEQYDGLKELWCSIRNDLFASHCVDVLHSGDMSNVNFLPNVDISDEYCQALRDPLEQLFSHHNPDAKAWVHLGLTGLRLYVPNYPHDPALQPMIERKMFIEKRDSLNKTLKALRQFQLEFTGQDTSMRIRRVESEIQSMGTEPPTPTIVRPEISQLDDLQGDFTNLLSIIRPLFNGSISAREASRDDTLIQNISRVIERLTARYQSYKDITDTVVGFLVCLETGLLLGQQEQQEKNDIQHCIRHLICYTPFLGFNALRTSASEALILACEDVMSQNRRTVDLRWHSLHCLAVIKSVDPSHLSSTRARELLHNVFVSLYEDWKLKLAQEQEKEAKSASLYTYREADENVDEADTELFPDYEENPENDHTNPSTSRDHAIRLANIHTKIFLEGSTSSESIKAMLQWCTMEINRVSESRGYDTPLEEVLPATYVLLEQKVDALSSSGTGKAYNFYFDPNFSEAKRLIGLVHRIQQRYKQIHNVWPEHATLTDVLRTCDEVLEFRHVDPVAKFITKAEKLHMYMYEWQRVASKEFSTSSLYDEITKMLISWRQLELATWASLFDMEIEKCRDDAKSWFFVAYEAIIAASSSIEDDIAMKTHARELLKTLEGFFMNTTAGQFEQRLCLLEQFRRQVALRMQDSRALEHVHLALQNFITYFSRLQQPVRETLSKGRQAIEKEVNDVIKLASWKDTNIEALKQSAKTSHRKLSKLIRKFRALLNQPISGLLKRGFSEEHAPFLEVQMDEIVSDIPSPKLDACAGSIHGWEERPSRFKNLGGTVSMMRRMSTPNPDKVDGAIYLASFVTDLETTMAQLRRETPATLTDENKETVQYLKSQKRKLYADTMKELRQMGIKSNLSSDLLAKQDELSTILTMLPHVHSEYTNFSHDAAHFLHNAINIMGQVREVFKEHSGDLTSNDVAKSIGYIEGLLHAAIRQHSALGKATESLGDLQKPTSQIETLCSMSNQLLVGVSNEQGETMKSLHPFASWLAAMTNMGSEMLSVQAKLGKTDRLAPIQKGMEQWSNRFKDLSRSLNSLPNLPSNTWTDGHQALYETIRHQVSDFRSALNDFMRDPMARTMFRPIDLFIFDYPEGNSVSRSTDMHVSVGVQAEEVFQALDLILGSMQDVETALMDFPTSTDDTAWLVKEEQALSTAICGLHSSQVMAAFQRVLENMQYLSEESDLNAVAALFSCVQPIINQYMASHKYLVERCYALHTSTTRLLYRLAKSFIEIGSQGFCQPPENSADQQPGKDDKLESGTGLGEGEGAEDISKDIQEDEDLEDLANEKKGDREGSIEDEENAVDMGEQEMEGETGEREEKEKEGSEGEEGDEDVQSQAGSVDDLGPSAVDEKMWDEGGREDDAKEKDSKDDVGTENKDEQVAAEKQDKKDGDEEKNEQQNGEEDEETEMEGEDQEENVGIGETEQMDPHANEEETLDLPDELNMDGNEDEKDDDDLGDMDMDDDLPKEEMDVDASAEPEAKEEEIGLEQKDEGQDATDHDKDDNEEMEKDENDEEEPFDDDMIPLPDEHAPEDDISEKKETDQSEQNAEAGAGTEANDEAHKDQKEQASASAAQREDGQAGESGEKNQEATTEQGALGQTAQPDAGGQGEQAEESRETQSFKKLGDVLERWYNQQKQINEAREKDETQMQQIDKEVDMTNANFEHLPDEETKPDTQALGTATEEQAKTLDQDMAMAVDEEDEMPARPEDKNEESFAQDGDVDMQEAETPQERDEKQEQQQSATDGRPQAFVGEEAVLPFDEDQDMEDAVPFDEKDSEISSIDDVETQLELTHLHQSGPISPETARALWSAHEASTHSLSQQLTEHLRLILAPTLATKLRGDFRTGKRLNLKRIIPYIASGYKRDKIWLRRSQPSKRSYQVMIALDDSKSMAENGASNLALKTLTLVTRSLSMLEVGEVSVVGFGNDINVAHEFDKPFTSEAGIKVFEQFGFAASKTDTRGLVGRSLDLFSEARRRGASGSGEDLWQLMLIVSDGICDSHAEIHRLVRRAQEERVMIVFIIIDSSASAPSAAAPASASGQAAPTSSVATPGDPNDRTKDKTSILDLQSVEITPEGKVVRWKYMERFPFRYYLVVRDVRELPGVLAGALRQWFGEVAGSV